MYALKTASSSYLLVRSSLSVNKARGFFERLDASHVIVHRLDAEAGYYLYSKPEILESLSGEDDQLRLADALNLVDARPMPAIDCFVDALELPDRAVITDAGRVIGFFDAYHPAPPRMVRRSGHEQGAGEARSATGSIVAQFPDQVPLNDVLSMLVSFSAAPEQGSLLPVSLPVGSQIDVIVVPKRGFVLEGRGEATIMLSDEQESLPVQIKLRATDIGSGRLQVLAFHDGQPLGQMILAPTVVEGEQMPEAKRESYRQEVTPRVRLQQPDLTLLILEQQSNGQTALTFRLTAADRNLGFHLKPLGPVILRTGPFQYFQEFFSDIEGLAMSSQQDMVKVEHKLAAKGAMLFEKLFPADLQQILWQLRDRIKVVQIESEEPWIPWELCKLHGHENGRITEGPYLCEAFALTRWLPGVGFTSGLELNKIGLVLPRDSHLPMATSEGEYLLSLNTEERQVERVPATFLELRAALAEGRYDGWHFTGHGGFRASDPNRSAMVLEDGDELTPEDLGGVVSNLGLAHPMVFLNACQIGRSAFALTDIGGWAGQFLRAGASAFIGSYWSIEDKSAHDFAQAFYQKLLEGESLGRAAQLARKAIKPLGGSTWLAYTIFADPWTTLRS